MGSAPREQAAWLIDRMTEPNMMVRHNYYIRMLTKK